MPEYAMYYSHVHMALDPLCWVALPIAKWSALIVRIPLLDDKVQSYDEQLAIASYSQLQ